MHGEFTIRRDLSDVTFIIPFYIDSDVRVRNIQRNLRHLTTLFDTNIIIGEQKHSNSAPLTSLIEIPAEKVDYYSFGTHSDDNPFCRTRVFNRLLPEVRTPFTCNLDCDFLAAPNQYLMSVQLLRWSAADFVIPYDARAVHVPEKEKARVADVLLSRALSDEEMHDWSEFVWLGHSVGGAIFADANAYQAAGGENENFLGWGWEDHERVIRFAKLGLRVRRVPGNFYHLSHPRGLTSSKWHAHYERNELELKRISQLSEQELACEIQSWNWIAGNSEVINERYSSASAQ